MPSMLRALTVFVCAALLAFVPASAQAAGSWSVTPTEYDFAPRAIGTGPSAPAVFTLTNTGTTTLHAPEFTFGFFIAEGVPQDHFELTSRCQGLLAPGESCAFEVTFEPTGIGQATEFVGLREPEGAAPSLQIRLTGSAAGAGIAFSPPAISLPSRLLGIELNPPSVLTVTNPGATDLHITSISVVNTGANPVNRNQIRIVGGTCGTAVTLPPGGSCTSQLTYTPAVVGAINAELQFLDDALERHLTPFGYRESNVGSEQLVPIRGNGAAFIEPPVAMDVDIVGHPPPRSRRTWARFRFAVPDAQPGFLCRLDTKPYRPCTSPTTYRHLALGRHAFRVRPAAASATVSGRAAVSRFRVLPALRRRG
jgi:hypothetical protein